MLSIRLEIGEIDYETCAEALLPPLVGKCAARAAPSELEKFVGKLGPDAVPIARSLLGYLDGDVKDRLVVALLTAHEAGLRGALNGYLAQLLPGPAVKIGCLSALDQPGSRLSLRASQIEVDYAALLDSPLVADGLDHLGGESSLLKSAAKLALQMGTRMPPEKLEKQVISLLGTDKVKSKLLTALADGLSRAGLAVTFRDMIVETTAAIELPESLSGGKDEGVIPDAVEDALMDAIIAWMRSRL